MPNIPVTSKPRLPICRVCWEAVALETGRTDENGQVIHEECFDRQQRNSSPKTKYTLPRFTTTD
jgi:hypothetical protein